MLLEKGMGERIREYFAEGIGRITGYVPNLVSALLILGVGYVLARLLGGATSRLLQRAGFDRLVTRRVHHKASDRGSPSTAVGGFVFWVGMLLAVSMASRALGLLTLSLGIDRILGYVPNVLVAAAIIAFGAALANVIANLIGDVTSPWIARTARVAVLALAVFMALDQLGIARNIVMTTFTALLGALAVAAAVAFGVGNRELAGQYTRRFLRRIEGDRERPSEPRPEGEHRPPIEPETTH